MSVFLLCEQAIGLVRGKRLILSTAERTMLENLNYEGLTAAHAQDEAVVCALHFARVRDRLLQSYAWTFAKKSATLANGATLPGDYLSMLYVLVNGDPVDYEVNGSYINVKSSSEIHYIAKITDTTKWASIFSDVFCYSLAIEICTAVTGKPEYTQVLEQKAQELIHRAFQIGAIKAETHITLTQEIYNRAISLARGQRTVAPTSTTATEQGIDNYGIPNDRIQAEIQACKRASDTTRDRLLSLHAWTFARKSAKLSNAVSAVDGWSYGYSLPSDCLKVLTVLSSGEPIDFEEVGTVLYCKVATPTIRYTAKITDMSSWSGAFIDVFVSSLAQEIVLATTHNLDTVQLLEQKTQILIRNAEKLGAIKTEVKIPASQEIYNRAISLVRGQRTISPTGNASAEQGVDITADINFREREAIAVCRRSLPEIRDKLLKLYAWKFARKTATLTATTKVSGWDYAYKLPSDCLRVLAVLNSDEPIEYEEMADMILCNATGTITARYTRAITDLTGLDNIFKDILCYELAQEISAALAWNTELITALEQKKQALIADAYKIGAIKIETRIPVKQELFNRAIGLVKGQKNGEQPDFINNRYEDEITACKRAFNSIRDRLLQSYAWIFARKTETPARLTEGTPGWRYTYLLPDDCLRVVAVIAPDKQAEYASPCDCREGFEYPDTVELTDYETNGSELYTNSEVVYIRYTARVDDISQWAASFTDAFVIMLAIEVCLNVTDDKPRVQLLEQRLLKIIEDAKENKLIYIDTGLPKKRQTRRSLAREVPYMDYSGIPTLACSPLGYCGRSFV